MEVKILGPVDALVGRDQVAVSANQRLLIAVLAANVGAAVAADRLVEAVWSDRLPANPLAALQNLVSRVRSRLPSSSTALVTSGAGYLLDPSACAVDWLRFEQLLESARVDGDQLRAMESYRAALTCWRGPAYGELADQPELADHARRLEELAAIAREEMLALMTQLDPVSAVAELESLVAREPFRERGHALLMEALHRSHRQRDALQVYRRHERFLADELGLAPSAALRQLETLIVTDALDQPQRHVGHRLVPPPAVGADRSAPGAHNLPERRSSFVGRADDLSAIRDALAERRLVTIVGAGGAGKTSLGVEAAREMLGSIEGRAFLIDLLTMAEGRRLPELVAAVLGLGALDADDPMRALAAALSARPTLLVLDNCEHVADATADFADALLGSTATVRILATSRVPLYVEGELVYRLAPLALPEPGGALATVLDSASGRLLADRMAAADSTFRLEELDTAAVVTICRRLDGLPLALELAAARAPSLGVGRVAARLDDRFGLLTKRNLTGAPHHQTLRATIAWSADLLDPRPRRLLSELGVFVGGFDLDAAEAVCAESPAESEGIGDALSVLVEHSLVTVERDGADVRYRLLETVREFALAELGEREGELRLRHWRWARGLAAAIGDGFLTHTAAWYRRLRTDFPNLRAAYRWSLDEGDPIGALDIAASLRWAPFNTGHLYAEHGEWVDQALRAARRTAVDATTVARGLVSAGAVAGLESRSAAAVQLLREAMHVLDAADQTGEVVWCYMWLAAFLSDLGDHSDAVRHSERGLAVAERSGDQAAVTYLANQHGEAAMSACLLQPAPRLFAVAEAAFGHAAEVAVAHGIEEGRVRAMHGAALLVAADDPADSLRRCRDALGTWRQLGQGNRLIMGLVSSARVAMLAGEDREAAAMVAEAAATIAQVGWRQPLGRLLETAAVAALRRGDATAAARFAGAAAGRFHTPRWYVPIDEDGVLAAGRAVAPERWDRDVAAGRRLADGELIELLRGAGAGADATAPR